MTVRELVNELTRSDVNWDLDATVCITDRPVKSWEQYGLAEFEIDHCDLFFPIWYENDRCILLLKRGGEKW